MKLLLPILVLLLSIPLASASTLVQCHDSDKSLVINKDDQGNMEALLYDGEELLVRFDGVKKTSCQDFEGCEVYQGSSESRLIFKLTLDPALESQLNARFQLAVTLNKQAFNMCCK